MDFIPKRDSDLDKLEALLLEKYPAVATRLGINTTDVSDTTSIISNHRSIYSTMNQKKAESKSAVEANAASKALTTAEIRRIANLVKNSKGYTDATGLELGIIGTVDVDADLETIKPTLKSKLVGGNIVISFNKQKMDGVKIFSKRTGETEFTFLAVDTASPYEDNRPKLNAGTPEERQYYAFYLLDDEQVGQQSDILTATI